MEDFIEKLKDALEDEAADVEKYLEMASEAQSNPALKKYAPILGDIAREEKIHHKHIHSILCDLGVAKQDSVPLENAEEGGGDNE